MFNGALCHSKLRIANNGVPVRLRGICIICVLEFGQLIMVLRRLCCLDGDLHRVKERWPIDALCLVGLIHDLHVLSPFEAVALVGSLTGKSHVLRAINTWIHKFAGSLMFPFVVSRLHLYSPSLDVVPRCGIGVFAKLSHGHVHGRSVRLAIELTFVGEFRCRD